MVDVEVEIEVDEVAGRSILQNELVKLETKDDEAMLKQCTHCLWTRRLKHNQLEECRSWVCEAFEGFVVGLDRFLR